MYVVKHTLHERGWYENRGMASGLDLEEPVGIDKIRIVLGLG